MTRLKKLPLSLRLVRELHAKLMTGVRGDTATPGEFRRTQNWVGPAGATAETATYVPPPAEELMGCLGPWERFLHERTLPPLVHVALAHYPFEIVIEKEPEDEGYLAFSPTLPGCFSNGKTIEEAKRNIRDAIQQHIASLLAHDQPVPQNERRVHVEELTVGVP